MKLTIQRLKQLIKEEIQKLEEGIPARILKASEEGKINYNNINVKYYYYAPAGEKQDVDTESIRAHIKDLKDDYRYEDGTYRVVRGGSALEKQIMTNLNNPAGWEKLRDDDRSMIFVVIRIPDANKLIASGDILHQPQKR